MREESKFFELSTDELYNLDGGDVLKILDTASRWLANRIVYTNLVQTAKNSFFIRTDNGIKPLGEVGVYGPY